MAEAAARPEETLEIGLQSQPYKLWERKWTSTCSLGVVVVIGHGLDGLLLH